MSDSEKVKVLMREIQELKLSMEYFNARSSQVRSALAARVRFLERQLDDIKISYQEYKLNKNQCPSTPVSLTIEDVL